MVDNQRKQFLYSERMVFPVHETTEKPVTGRQEDLIEFKKSVMKTCSFSLELIFSSANLFLILVNERIMHSS